ncbi:aminotransferase class V-fold PLP-dependent enzyme [Clostridium folliculivorans]|uniref:aminotransferase class V-fold PLP-dependent enzyme n=1 Tax=Clostridium folliculivorans TaxID=2886038 RepID=UPI0021C28DDF|nr:aminotransferase class V-fold PLP-dependent enzyme [Clostridium folliculivorans]GKU28736.1 class V aminotransferase [Clostridium folliculivorans]
MMKKREMNFRELFLGIEQAIPLANGRKITPINFDNAATTPAMKQVLHCVNKFLPLYGSIGRGKGYKSKVSTELYNDARDEILKFFNLSDRDDYTVIFVKNTTEGINTLVNILIEDSSEIVLTTRMEHHSNDLPWREKCVVEYVEVDDNGRLKIDQFQERLDKAKGSIKLVSVTGASNVTGYINDIHKIAKIAHKNGAEIIVDGAQLVPHRKVDMNYTDEDEDDDIDYLVFSAHKMYAPFGSGAIVGKKNKFNNSLPLLKGGGTVDIVTDDEVYWLDAPERDEGGTPNVLGVIALVAAIYEFNRIGFNNIEEHEDLLRDYLSEGLRSMPDVITYGDLNDKNKLGLVSINLKNIYHEDLAGMLSDLRGIAVRSGCFCAQPYAKRLLDVTDEEVLSFIRGNRGRKPGMVRISFGMYNTINEINEFLNVLEYIIRKHLY